MEPAESDPAEEFDPEPAADKGCDPKPAAVTLSDGGVKIVCEAGETRPEGEPRTAGSARDGDCVDGDCVERAE